LKGKKNPGIGEEECILVKTPPLNPLVNRKKDLEKERI
jgi:hypothetical protein